MAFLTCSLSAADDGKVVYSFESGKMQCSSEIDGEGNLSILLESLHTNTKLHFKNVFLHPTGKLILSLLMCVEQDTDFCAGWVNAQEVSIAIYPKAVDKITLNGKKLFQKDKITVMNVS